MANVNKIQFILNEPFTNFIKNLLNEKFFSTSPNKVARLLEVGCGPGDFALILKDTLKDKIDITAIDPSDDIEKAFKKSTGSEVYFIKDDIFTFKSEQKFDLVLFSKSLHHCNPVDQALQNAYSLLSDTGILIAEETQIDSTTDSDATWFFDRLDLLRSANCFIPKEERLEAAGPTQKSMISKVLDPSLPVSQRWFTAHSHTHGAKHEHEHQHGHGHSHRHSCNHSHEHNHEHSHDHQIPEEEQKKLDREDPNKIAAFNTIRAAIEAQFGKENVQMQSVPYLYQFLVFLGLKTDETCQTALSEIMKQEYKAIQESRLNPFGLNIVAFKKN